MRVDNNQISQIEQEQGNAQPCPGVREPRASCNVKQNRKPSTDILCRIGTNVRRLRKARGYSQQQLGGRCGLTKGYVSQVEQERLNVGIANLEALAMGLDCSIEDLTMRPPCTRNPSPFGDYLEGGSSPRLTPRSDAQARFFGALNTRSHRHCLTTGERTGHVIENSLNE